MKCRSCGAKMEADVMSVVSCYIECPSCGTIHKIKCRHKADAKKRIRSIKLVSPAQVNDDTVFFGTDKTRFVG